MSNQNWLQQEAVYGLKYGTGEKYQIQVKCRVRDQNIILEYEPQAPEISNASLNIFRSSDEKFCISLSTLC